MLSKPFRLPATVHLTGTTRYTTPFFQIRISSNKLSHNRYGFIISKKVDKRAVVRNRIKRQLRAWFEKNDKGLVPGYDMLLVVSREAVEKETTLLWQTLTALCTNEKLFR